MCNDTKEWDDRRQELEAALVKAAGELIDHMGCAGALVKITDTNPQEWVAIGTGEDIHALFQTTGADHAAADAENERLKVRCATLALRLDRLARAADAHLPKRPFGHEAELVRSATDDALQVLAAADDVALPEADHSKVKIVGATIAKGAPGIDVALLVDRELFRFSSKQDWVNSAKRRFARCGVARGDYIAVDALGRVCTRGRDFMRAEDEGAYPIVVFATYVQPRPLSGEVARELPHG